MSRIDTDILIVGGGIAGRLAALAVAHAGWQVVLAAPGTPETNATSTAADLRSTAYLQPSQALLAQIGVWQAVGETATPLEALRIVDAVGDPPALREARTFDASDLGPAPFAWNVLNVHMHRALESLLANTPGVTLLDAAFEGMLVRDKVALARLSGGHSIAARLVVGADGRHSAVREAAGISTALTRSGQTALAFVASHAKPHHNVSIEVYHEGGPCTLVPMPDQNGAPASAVVWMMPGPLAEARSTLSADDLAPILSARTCHELGPMRPESHIARWPIRTQRARAVTAQRTLLMAEAAHVMPPIGAQGLNTSLQDIIALRDTLAEATDPGEAGVLARYARARTVDTAARMAAVDLLNAVSSAPQPGVQALRRAGLKVAHDIKPLRMGLMRAGLGAEA